MTFDQKVDDWRSRRLPKIKKSRATLEAEIIRLTARVAELEAALRPLAEMAERYDPDDGDDGNLECCPRRPIHPHRGD